MIPEKCINCIHHKKTNGGGDIQILHDSEYSEVDYCDYTEYYNEIGVPVPYPYFFKQEYPCKGYEVEGGGGRDE